MPEREPRQSNIVDRFARLNGGESRLAQLISAKGSESSRNALGEDIVILDKPQGTFFERLKEDLAKIIKPVGGKIAVPATVAIMAVVAACSSGVPKEIHLEAEKGDGIGEFRHRGNASNNATIWLHEGESRTMEFKISKSAVYSVGVRYSNDGDPDNVSVIIDRGKAGQLMTIDTGEAGAEPGEGWNNFEEANIAEAINLTSGKHKVEVIAIDTDSYGVEIDKVFMFRVDNEK